jgi:hypothetical protein
VVYRSFFSSIDAVNPHWLPWPMRFDWQTIWSTDSGEAGMPV